MTALIDSPEPFTPGLIGPSSSDAELAAWRDAATTGALPTPTRERWQVLRCGVVNLWEFDVAEYWFADGRAQFVGQNQSGKSTLMALTTLIMLAGDLDRSLVDTFGMQHKSFRYYVEPTDDPTDRRGAEHGTSRGWAWVEYSRLVDGEATYFTTLLYAQAKRGANDYVKAWATCEGSARVGDGLDLHCNAATAQPGDLADVPGYSTASGGKEYKLRVSQRLFGFDDTERLDAVVRMLKVLRTPHLGQKLDPEFFTARMREALPAVAKSEIDELAEGWDQLDRLAADRDSAQNARDAVSAYVRRAWNPWADSVLRRHADELVGANSRLEGIARGVRDADQLLSQVEEEQRQLTARLAAGRDELDRDDAIYEQMLESRAYLDAHDATDKVARLKAAARTRGVLAGNASAARAAGGQRVTSREVSLATEAEALEGLRVAQTSAVDVAIADAVAAGLPRDCTQWATQSDTGRLRAALTERHGFLDAARRLLRRAHHARSVEEEAARRAQDAEDELARRQTADDQAAATLASRLQELSDLLERWAVGLEGDAPDLAERTSWVAAVLDQTGRSAPRAVLGALVRGRWLTPATTPLREQAALADRAASDLTGRADALDTEVQVLLDQTDPAPGAPSRWTRRHRPEPGTAGAPLWRLLDPAPDLESSTLDRLEAALDASGLLDAWVTPDGAYVPERDGFDSVITLVGGGLVGGGMVGGGTVGGGMVGGDVAMGQPKPLRASAAGSLALALRPADDAGECTGTVTALLSMIGFAADGDSAYAAGAHAAGADGDSAHAAGADGDRAHDAGAYGDRAHAAGAYAAGAYAIAPDGRWRSPVSGGRAAPAAHGAELIGTAARTASRARKVAELRAEAADLRSQAEHVRTLAATLRGRVTELELRAGRAPTDDAVVHAALAVAAAHRELDLAQARQSTTQQAYLAARGAAADANTELLTFTGDHALPHDDTGLAATGDALTRAATAIAALALAAAQLEAGALRHASAAALLREAQDELVRLEQAAVTLTREAAEVQDEADRAEAALGQDEHEILAAAEELKAKRLGLKGQLKILEEQCQAQQGEVATAREKLQRAGADREEADAHRDRALVSWWGPVDAGLARSRQLPEIPSRVITHALTQARAAREMLRPAGWPEAPEAVAERDARVNAAWARLSGPALIELRAVLESSGGRSVTVVDVDALGALPAVSVLVDSSGTQVDPVEAIVRLGEQSDKLAQLHDEKMQEVLVELLSSTFVEHLRERLGAVVELLARVNKVLAAHPTGANSTTLRLRRTPAAGQQSAFDVLGALERGFVDSDAVQAQVRVFLEQQIREAQDLGRGSAREWKDHLADLLDYRCWFDVVTDYRVADTTWRALTKEVHAKDSGGGKVVTLMQPLLATLVALYDESARAPRPLWLDEAFTGVDDDNRATMLDLLVTFDLDFLLAGPGTLVTAAQVPSAAVWYITRAPAPDPGVDLSLLLWAGLTLTAVPLPAGDLGTPGRRQHRALDDGPDLFGDDDLATG